MIETDSNVIFNPTALQELIELEKDGEKGLVKSLIADYQENSTKILQQVCQEIVKKEVSQIEIRIHSLKSSSALLGLEKLAGLCQRLEDNVKKQIPSDAEIQHLKEEHRLAIEALVRFTQLSESP